MAKSIKIVALSAVLAAIAALATCAWAGDLKGKVSAQEMHSPANIVVYIDSIPGKTFPPPVLHAVMDQMQMEFVPHVLVVLKGTTVNFLNDDPVQHNVYWPSIDHNRALAHNMGTWPQGIVKSYTFNNLGDVPLLCKTHSEMSGHILVVPTPYFAVTDKEGNYMIKNVPPGQYVLKTWSEQAQPTEQAVTIAAAPDTGKKTCTNCAPCNCCTAQSTNVDLTVKKRF